MSWFSDFLTSSIGRKLIMSLTGLFLIIFLLVHLVGNLQLLYSDGGEAFNIYAKFMTTNPLIKGSSYLLYTGILLHALLGIVIWRKNAAAKGQGYAVSTTHNASFSSKNMAWLGIIILAFLILHLIQFWLKTKMGTLVDVQYAGETYHNLYDPVAYAFSQWWYVLIYVFSMIVIGLHLNHGFQSAFQTLGLNHKKYTPLIKFLGTAYSILIPLGFAIIPIYMYLNR